ncbi:hypothetical protein HMPREF9098_1705 [Kingella denitrificans ATCC 33394]|uniref:DUF4375 domain-containing protein n=2 Tax=Kingella denitrificans TaxID=502 RepID=F0F0S0_9NEIS|nr:hypothetical protein HMPREF9098_1705 [Kingella denitrificans ATCC 33394]
MRTGTKPKTFKEIAVALYADGNGKYQKEYDELWSAFVPESGSATSLQGELVRLIGRLASEYYRNGNMNWELGYQNMAHCLQAELNKAFPEKREIINGIVARIISDAETGECDYRDDEDEYDILTDYVVEFCQKYLEMIPNNCPKIYGYDF